MTQSTSSRPAAVIALPARTTQEAAERAFAIRRLYLAGAVDRVAAIAALDALAAHDNQRIAGLCVRVATEIKELTS